MTKRREFSDSALLTALSYTVRERRELLRLSQEEVAHRARLHRTYISDIVDGIIACVEKKFGFEIFNLGESRTVTLNHLIELLEQSLGKKAVIERKPDQPGDVPVTYADITKARSLLGYNPHTKIAEGIPKFVEWFRAKR